DELSQSGIMALGHRVSPFESTADELAEDSTVAPSDHGSTYTTRWDAYERGADLPVRHSLSRAGRVRRSRQPLPGRLPPNCIFGHGGPDRLCGTLGRCDSRHGRTSQSEEHTSELQSRENLVCRLLLEKKK